MTSLASGAVTSTTESVWEGGRLALERVTGSTGVSTYRYVYGPGSLPLELIVTTAQGTASYAYLCDGAGSVVALTDSSGAVVAAYAYDPWGAPTSQPASGIGARNPLRYRGYYYDVATALYYLPARYYDPQTARFLSADPAPPSAGDPLSLNRYAYCVGDPINRGDPSGARHEMGSGVAGRVSEDAVKLARNGALRSARVVQRTYRESIQANYAKGYDFKWTGILADKAAGWMADKMIEACGDGSAYGRFNMTPRRSRERGYIGFEGSGSAVEVVGQLLEYGATKNGQRKLARQIEAGGLAIDLWSAASTIIDWG